MAAVELSGAEMRVVSALPERAWVRVYRSGVMGWAGWAAGRWALGR